MMINPLGQKTEYVDQYKPNLLFAIARSEKRAELNCEHTKFKGEDIWNAYEISWLNADGLPRVAIGELKISASSDFIVESKSLKLYLNSLNQTRFQSKQDVAATIVKDLTELLKWPVEVSLYSPREFSKFGVGDLVGHLIDDSNVDIDDESFNYQPELLLKATNNKVLVTEKLVSHLLKSNCLITNQPDWASIQITYQGHQIKQEKLLQYLISFRSHNEFHEQCVERIFGDIKKYCKPEKLTVYARYTRRGGLDINPWRSDFEEEVENVRLARQ